MNYIVPIVAVGAATVAVVSLMHHEKEHKKMVRSMPRPLTIPERVNRFKQKCHQYIELTALDKRDVQHKRHLVDRSLHEHCHRHLTPLFKMRSHRRHISRKCVGICEKVCAEFHIMLKPRCDLKLMGGKYHAHADLAVNLFEINYNHAPTTKRMGLRGGGF
jgi:hypothetical protein